MEVLDDVVNALKQQPRIAPGVGALIEALRPRLKDNQVALVLLALQALGALASSAGRPIKLHLRAAVPEILYVLADGKQQVRDAAIETLDKWVAEIGFEPLLPLLPRALTMEAPAGRAANKSVTSLKGKGKPTVALTRDTRHLAESRTNYSRTSADFLHCYDRRGVRLLHHDTCP